MSQIKLEKLPESDLQAIINIRLTRADYGDKYTKALQKIAQKTSLQGFRPGKVPVKLVEKIHGRSVFIEETMRVAQAELFGYLEKEKLDILLSPVVSIKEFNLDPGLEEQDFSFEIGIKPEINLDFLQEIKLQPYDVAISDVKLQQEIQNIRKSRAKAEKVEKVGEQDLTCVNLEYSSGDTTQKLTLWLRDLTQEAFQLWKDLSVNAEITINIDKDFSAKAKAGLSERFEKDGLTQTALVRISEIRSLVLPELDSQFFTQVFPNNSNINTVEEFRETLRKLLEQQFVAESKYFSHTQLNHILASQSQIPLPEAFIKRWLEDERRNQQKQDKPLGEEELISLLGGIRRQLILQKFIKKENIQEPDAKELQEFIANKLTQQYQGYNLPTETYKQLLTNILNNEEYLDKMRNECMDQKAMQILAEQVALPAKNIDDKQFREISEKFYAELK